MRNARQLPTDDSIPVLVPFSDARLKHDKEAVVPRRIVAQISIQHVFYKREFPTPQRVVIEVGQDPLPVRPGVVILGIVLQGVGDERELRCGVVGLLH